MKIGAFMRTVGAPTCCALAALLLPGSHAPAETPGSVSQADHKLLQAFEKKDHSVLDHFLDANFIWIDSSGRRLTRTELLETFPAVANADSEAQARIYGDSAIVRVNRGKMNVLRIWAKRAGGWRALLYQEVLQVEQSEQPGGKPSAECINPCQSIPYQPQTQAEREAIASWQGVMKAMAENDPDAYAPLIADEFTATDTYHERPYSKADRLAQIGKQKLNGTHSSPPELKSAEMLDFGETVLMVAKEQRPGAKSYWNTRMWVKRDGRWQMLFSFNTRIE
jgi:hypothetical protein